MQQEYVQQPRCVEAFCLPDHKTDIILRKNIQKITKTLEDIPEIIWECDEVQHRVPGCITAAQVLERFDFWWTWTPNRAQVDADDQRLQKIEADLEYIAMMCDVEL